MKYQVVIGLEVHAQLKTKTKLFCSCAVEFGAEPNTHVCPVCLGMPGALPVPNGKALEFAALLGLATGCTVRDGAMWTRKNYFYPDLPKGYQITQQGGMPLYDLPICHSGFLEIEDDQGNPKKIGLKRIHLEEDAGKLIHDLTPDDSLFDANRCGTPLTEIVSEPDLRSAGEAVRYLQKLKQTLEYLEICDADMEKGNLRCDVNISLRENESAPLGNRIELKNMNSFSNVEKAIQVEVELQTEVLQSGGKIEQETKRWDPATGTTITIRTKEDAEDYHYFPDPDLPPLNGVDEAFLEKVSKIMPELPEQIRARYQSEFGLSEYDARVLTAEKPVARFFEEAANNTSDKKSAANWVMGEVLRTCKEADKAIDQLAFNGKHIADLVNLITKGTISGKIAKTVFGEMAASGKNPGLIVEEKGLKVMSDEGQLQKIIQDIVSRNPAQKEQFQAGKTKIMGFFVGQVMRETKGKADPTTVNRLLKTELEKK